MEKITHIEKLEIKELWGKYQIEWNLNRDVNILAGINGSGKTTVLNSIAWMLAGGNFLLDVDNNLIKEIKISLNNKQILNWSYYEPASFNFSYYKLSDTIKTQIISTFEQPIKITSVNFPEKIKTDLDSQIFELQRAYLSYQINLGKRVEQVFSEDAPIDIKTKRQEIYGKKERFTQTINQFFAITGKTIESDDSNEIVFRQNDKILTPYQLSSGEKQVLLILLSALIQDNQPYILIMDEPEISLHIDWQEQLIQVIRSLNENVQIILATHSPALVMKGWMDKVTEMEDITSDGSNI